MYNFPFSNFELLAFLSKVSKPVVFIHMFEKLLLSVSNFWNFEDETFIFVDQVSL